MVYAGTIIRLMVKEDYMGTSDNATDTAQDIAQNVAQQVQSSVPDNVVAHKPRIQ